MMESSKKIGGSDFAGSIYGLLINVVRDALLDTLMGMFFIEIGRVFIYRSLN